MKYCENCRLVIEDGICPRCYSSRLREPQNGDFCLLTERNVTIAQMLMELLKDNGIECVFTPVLGAGLATKLGPIMERNRLFVPYEKLTQADALQKAFFEP